MRQILVISVGLAPQVVTEFMWWVAVSPDGPGTVPDEIHITTTRRGAEVAETSLLGAQGKLSEFSREFGLPDLRARVSLHFATGDDLGPGEDTRDLEANIGYANMATRLLRDLTADPGGRVHACLAGGRKTMSFYMGYAMSLLGREHDELSHVLVWPPEFENCADFWWIPKVPRRIPIGAKGQEIWRSTGEAAIEVVRIPFVRLRHLMGSGPLGSGEVNFARFIVDARRTMGRQRLTLNDERLEIGVGDSAARLPPKKYALYRLLAEVRRDGWPGAGPDGIGPDQRGWLSLDLVDLPGNTVNRRFLEIYENLPQSRIATGQRSLRDIQGAMLPDELRDEFNREIANINRLLDQRFDDYILRDCVRIKWVRGDRRKGIRRRFGLAFEPNRIEIV